jgi:hypothetical protein
MEGVPIQQALKSVEACLGALSSEDEFGIVAFDDKVTILKTELLRGDSEAREGAKRFLASISARGGTELLAGLLEAYKLLQARGGDVFLVTDGQVFGTEQIIQRAKSGGIRIHCLRIGSASQDRFLSLLARGTGGVSRIVSTLDASVGAFHTRPLRHGYLYVFFDAKHAHTCHRRIRRGRGRKKDSALLLAWGIRHDGRKEHSSKQQP